MGARYEVGVCVGVLGGYIRGGSRVAACEVSLKR